jgi:YVTN family beta-propeller protein
VLTALTIATPADAATRIRRFAYVTNVESDNVSVIDTLLTIALIMIGLGAAPLVIGRPLIRRGNRTG